MNYIPPPKQFTPGTIVDVYLRDSGGEGQERSIVSQLSEMQEYCKLHHLILRRIYKDEAKSGRGTIGRTQFDAMIEEYKTEADNPKGLLIWDYARFARNTKDAIYSISTIEHHHIVIHSLIDYIPEGDFRDVGRVMKHMGNQAESEKNSAAVKRMQHQLVRNHGAMFGVPPRGFMRSDLPPIRNERTNELRALHKWIPDPTIAPLVLRAFEMRAAHCTLSEIREATGLYKAVTCYTTFFSNKLYKGVLEFGGLTIENYCEPVVPPELWDQVNALRKATKPGNRTNDPRRVRSDFLLSGLVVCQSCGDLMVGHRIGKYSYYICPRRKRTKECHAPHIPKEKLEHGILNALEEKFTLEMLLSLQGQISHELQRGERDVTRARIKLDRDADTVRKQIANLTNAIAARGHGDSLLNALDALEQEAAQIKLDQIELDKQKYIPRHKLPQLKAIAAEIKRISISGTPEERRTLLRSYITRILASNKPEMRAHIYYLPIKILTRLTGELGLPSVPPRGQWDEAQLEVIIL